MENYQQNPQQNQAQTPESKPPLSEEERKALSRKRIFWGVIGVNIILISLIVFEIIYIFVG
ncbi:MAG: hypothetical protein IJ247_04305 [Bacilli bacterium]|nr:hypothetical protein [Bacilli bacterium]